MIRDVNSGNRKEEGNACVRNADDLCLGTDLVSRNFEAHCLPNLGRTP